MTKSIEFAKLRHKLPKHLSKHKAAAARARLKGSVLRYDDPLAPVQAPKEWDMNR